MNGHLQIKQQLTWNSRRLLCCLQLLFSIHISTYHTQNMSEGTTVLPHSYQCAVARRLAKTGSVIHCVRAAISRPRFRGAGKGARRHLKPAPKAGVSALR